MHIMRTTSGVLAIVGAGYLFGVGHALVRERPVILGATPVSTPGKNQDTDPSTDPIDDSTNGSDQQTESESTQHLPDQTIDPANSIDPNTENGSVSELDTMLDAPVPEGMLSLREAHQMWVEGAYFIDSRLPHEYEEGHISLAAYITAANFFTDEGQAHLETIPPDAPVVIYCIGGEECDASHNTLALLQQYGYTDLSIMGVGYDEWAAAGLPTSSTDEESQQGEGSP